MLIISRKKCSLFLFEIVSCIWAKQWLSWTAASAPGCTFGGWEWIPSKQRQCSSESSESTQYISLRPQTIEPILAFIWNGVRFYSSYLPKKTLLKIGICLCSFFSCFHCFSSFLIFLSGTALFTRSRWCCHNTCLETGIDVILPDQLYCPIFMVTYILRCLQCQSMYLWAICHLPLDGKCSR